jgi:two-component system, NtrC family, sensor kinase
MRRGPKPAKAKVEAKPPVSRKSRKREGSRVDDLETRLAEALGQLQTRDRELVEAQAQQTATSEILRVISSSPTDVQPVFDAIVKNAVELCGGVLGTVFRFDGERLHLAAHFNVISEGIQAFRDVYPMPVSRDTVAGCAILDCRVIQVPDSQAEGTVPWRSAAMARAAGFRGVVTVPMLRGEAPIGLIAVGRRESGLFSDREIALLQTFAKQAVIAIENVRLFNETKEALEQQTATAEILRVISQSPTDVQPVFDAIANSAVRICGAAFSGVFRFDGRLLHLTAHAGLTAEELEAAQHMFPARALPGGIGLSRVVLDRTVVHIADIRTDVEWPAALGRHTYLTPLAGYRTFLAVPLLHGGVCLGAINVWRREVSPFSEQQTDLLKTFADQAVIAIENVRLFTELEQKNQALTKAHAQVTEALDQQTATSEILRVISSSPMDVQPTFEAIAASAAKLCEAGDSGVFRFEAGSSIWWPTMILVGHAPTSSDRCSRSLPGAQA